MKYSIFVASEQVLDVSAEANIQRAATKVTNIEYFVSCLRWFRACLKNALDYLICPSPRMIYL